jgi:hypothetical protein
MLKRKLDGPDELGHDKWGSLVRDTLRQAQGEEVYKRRDSRWRFSKSICGRGSQPFARQ